MAAYSHCFVWSAPRVPHLLSPARRWFSLNYQAAEEQAIGRHRDSARLLPRLMRTDFHRRWSPIQVLSVVNEV